MAKLLASRSAQTVLSQDFTFNVATAADDKMATTVGNTISGAAPTFQTATQSIGGFYAGAAQVYEIMPLPVGATIVSGELVVTTAVVGPTASGLTIGDSGSAARYLGSTSLLAGGRTALVPTGYIGTGENIRMTVTNTVAVATAGKVTIRINYTVAGRTNETIVA